MNRNMEVVSLRNSSSYFAMCTRIYHFGDIILCKLSYFYSVVYTENEIVKLCLKCLLSNELEVYTEIRPGPVISSVFEWSTKSAVYS